MKTYLPACLLSLVAIVGATTPPVCNLTDCNYGTAQIYYGAAVELFGIAKKNAFCGWDECFCSESQEMLLESSLASLTLASSKLCDAYKSLVVGGQCSCIVRKTFPLFFGANLDRGCGCSGRNSTCSIETLSKAFSDAEWSLKKVGGNLAELCMRQGRCPEIMEDFLTNYERFCEAVQAISNLFNLCPAGCCDTTKAPRAGPCSAASCKIKASEIGVSIAKQLIVYAKVQSCAAIQSCICCEQRKAHLNNVQSAIQLYEEVLRKIASFFETTKASGTLKAKCCEHPKGCGEYMLEPVFVIANEYIVQVERALCNIARARTTEVVEANQLIIANVASLAETLYAQIELAINACIPRCGLVTQK